MAKVELLQNESTLMACPEIHTPNLSQGTLVGGTLETPIKLVNLPSLPLFCGADPTPKYEANYKQWLIQSRGH